MEQIIKRLRAKTYNLPWVKEGWSRYFQALAFTQTPWTPLSKPLSECKVALVTTGGVHLQTDLPFDMIDPQGDPSFRKISSQAQKEDLRITHDYYDHQDAERDINLVLPMDILRKCQQEGVIGACAEWYYGFMGHIEGPHLKTLIQVTARDVGFQLKQQAVDAALLVPA